jgi:hypothetical protein
VQNEFRTIYFNIISGMVFAADLSYKKFAGMSHKTKGVVDDIWLNTLADTDDPDLDLDLPDNWDEIEQDNISLNPDENSLDRG